MIIRSWIYTWHANGMFILHFMPWGDHDINSDKVVINTDHMHCFLTDQNALLDSDSNPKET